MTASGGEIWQRGRGNYQSIPDQPRQQAATAAATVGQRRRAAAAGPPGVAKGPGLGGKIASVSIMQM